MLVRSYRTVSPLPPLRVAVCFLWHFPASRLGLPLAITLLCEVRTFLDSLLREHEPRPPGQLVRANTVLVAECAGQRLRVLTCAATHCGTGVPCTSVRTSMTTGTPLRVTVRVLGRPGTFERAVYITTTLCPSSGATAPAIPSPDTPSICSNA